MTSPDLGAIQSATKLLSAGRYAVSVFPAGNPDHCSDTTGAKTLRQKIPNATQNENRSEARERELHAGDQCLSAIWRQLGKPDATRLQVSLSHSEGWAIGFGRLIEAQMDPISGVGVDIERSSREVREDLRRKLVLPKEHSLELSLLEFWVIKEACFKAFPENKGRTISEFEIMNFDRSTSIGEASTFDGAKFRFVIHSDALWLTALAICFAA